MIARLTLSLIKTAFLVGWESGAKNAYKQALRNPSAEQDRSARDAALDEFLNEHIPGGRLYPHRAERLRDKDA